MWLGHAVCAHVPMDIDVSDHAVINKLGFHKITGEIDDLLLIHLARNRKFDLAGKLGILAQFVSFRLHSTARNGRPRQHTELKLTFKAIKRAKAMRNRIEASQRRTDKREWVMQRRERTRHLIELGGLVQKSGLVELTDDDRAAIYGVLLVIAIKLREENRDELLALWRRRGKRAFEDEAGSIATQIFGNI